MISEVGTVSRRVFKRDLAERFPQPKAVRLSQLIKDRSWPRPGTRWNDTLEGVVVEVLSVSVLVGPMDWVIAYRNLVTNQDWTRTVRYWLGKEDNGRRRFTPSDDTDEGG